MQSGEVEPPDCGHTQKDEQQAQPGLPRWRSRLSVGHAGYPSQTKRPTRFRGWAHLGVTYILPDYSSPLISFDLSPAMAKGRPRLSRMLALVSGVGSMPTPRYRVAKTSPISTLLPLTDSPVEPVEP